MNLYCAQVFRFLHVLSICLPSSIIGCVLCVLCYVCYVWCVAYLHIQFCIIHGVLNLAIHVRLSAFKLDRALCEVIHSVRFKGLTPRLGPVMAGNPHTLSSIRR